MIFIEKPYDLRSIRNFAKEVKQYRIIECFLRGYADAN